jgi:4-amino-4-deoxy-L-arabinose transferase-like glycosyltransferase
MPAELSSKNQFWLLLPILLLFSYFPVFHDLDKQSVRMWDESFYAVNAYEMMGNGKLFVKYFDGQPDSYNLKPPLMTWIQSLSFRLFGVGEFALRFPSALSGFLLVFLIFLFFYQQKIPPLVGFLTAMILITSPGFICNHVVRTGDYDAPLSLMLFLALWFYYLFLTKVTNQSHYLYLTTLFLILAVYVKGIAGLLFLPAMFVQSLLFRKFKYLLSLKAFYISTILFIGLIASYYLVKESLQPGYLSAWMKYESIGRFMQVQDGHSHPFYYYFGLLFSEQFVPWIYFLPLSLIFYLREENASLKNILRFAFQSLIFYLLVISFSKSKLEWYTAPVIPLLAILSAYGLFRSLCFILGFLKVKQQQMRWILFIILVTLVFVYPYIQTINRITHPPNKWAANKYGDYFKHLKANYPDFKSFTVIEDGFNSHLVYYRSVFNMEYGYNIQFTMTFQDTVLFNEVLSSLKSGDKVMLSQNKVLMDLKKRFDVWNFHQYEELRLFEIKEKKQAIDPG